MFAEWLLHVTDYFASLAVCNVLLVPVILMVKETAKPIPLPSLSMKIIAVYLLADNPRAAIAMLGM